jgi:hypothetical protein
MTKLSSIFQLLKPGIPKRNLLFVAALMWTIAGGMLFFRGFSMLFLFHRLLWLKLIGSLTGGLVFYRFMFSKISSKHIQRILKMEIERPCFFSFFKFQSYIMMAVMISMGIALRTNGIVPIEYLSILYVTMGVPLTLSTLRFYYNGIYYQKALAKSAHIQL